MNKELLSELKQKLEKSKTSLETNLRSFAVKDKEGDNWETKFPVEENCDDIECETDEVEEYENLLPVEHTLELKLRDVNIALEKIEKGEYGKCEKCQKEIEEERLKVIPETKTCTSCKI